MMMIAGAELDGAGLGTNRGLLLSALGLTFHHDRLACEAGLALCSWPIKLTLSYIEIQGDASRYIYRGPPSSPCTGGGRCSLGAPRGFRVLAPTPSGSSGIQGQQQQQQQQQRQGIGQPCPPCFSGHSNLSVVGFLRHCGPQPCVKELRLQNDSTPDPALA